jgi:hypothetical protein
MKPHRPYAALTLGALACILAMSATGCDVAPIPGRFTYVVKYEVTANAPATVDIEYQDEIGYQDMLPPTVPLPTVTGLVMDAASPWTYEFPVSFTYDYDNPFYAYLKVDATSLPNLGDTVTLKIIWKDYRVDFEEQVLAYAVLENTGSPPAGPAQRFSPELPRP